MSFEYLISIWGPNHGLALNSMIHFYYVKAYYLQKTNEHRRHCQINYRLETTQNRIGTTENILCYDFGACPQIVSLSCAHCLGRIVCT
jgi:hypothetical protein